MVSTVQVDLVLLVGQLVLPDQVHQDHPVDPAGLFDLAHPRDLAVHWALVLLLFLVVLAHHPRQ